jgi:hypothetical protein
MNLATTFWLTLVGLLTYVLAVEPLFFQYLLLQVLRLTTFISRCWMMVAIHPDSPWVQYKINRNADSIATQLLNEINERSQGKSDDDDNAGRPPVE